MGRQAAPAPTAQTHDDGGVLSWGSFGEHEHWTNNKRKVPVFILYHTTFFILITELVGL